MWDYANSKYCGKIWAPRSIFFCDTSENNQEVFFARDDLIIWIYVMFKARKGRYLGEDKKDTLP